jgi:hypothetical protein
VTELLVIAGLVAAGIAWISARRRAALARARLRAEGMLDELAEAACAAIARGDDPSSSRRCARAVDRYERYRERVAAARTPRELDGLVARHELRQSANAIVSRGLERARELVTAGVPTRR